MRLSPHGQLAPRRERAESNKMIEVELQRISKQKEVEASEPVN